jgi:glycosyltransferase involved in cell wall biosynthesis
MKKFSIVIPNYNCAPYLEDCLNSIFAQSFNDYEVIVIDDGSTDNSLDIINRYNVQLFHSPRLRPGGARNIGLSHATGEYIVFLDSDDYFFPEVLSKLNDAVKKQDVIFLGFFNEKLNKNIIPSLSPKEEYILKDVWLACHLKCWRREFLTWKFPENMLLEDVYFTLKGYCSMDSFSVLPIPFLYYRFRAGSTQNKTREAYRKESKEHIKLLMKEYPQYEEQLKGRL